MGFDLKEALPVVKVIILWLMRLVEFYIYIHIRICTVRIQLKISRRYINASMTSY